MNKKELKREAAALEKTYQQVKKNLFALNLPISGYKDGKVMHTYRDGTVTEITYNPDGTREEIIVVQPNKS
jgi:hypothetical protein